MRTLAHQFLKALHDLDVSKARGMRPLWSVPAFATLAIAAARPADSCTAPSSHRTDHRLRSGGTCQNCQKEETTSASFIV